MIKPEDYTISQLTGPELDKYMAPIFGITRKISLTENNLCDVFYPYEGVWTESDAKFRERLKRVLKGDR